MSIVFRNIHKAFGPKRILDGVSLEIREGECFFVIGASGVGKSVLIKHLVGLLRADEGEILLDGQNVENLSETALYPVRKRCAMVFQNSTLFDSMTCRDNVALPLRKHQRMSQRQARDKAMDFLAQVQMERFAESYPAELGDGLKKRVAIARALTLSPEYILFDEPTTSLDPVSARRVDELIRTLCTKLGVTAVVVSHDLTSIFTIADRIAMLYQGKVRLLGTPEAFKTTDDPVVQQFIHGRAEGPMEV